MRVYKVSPIVKYSPFFSLTYISSLEFVVGDIVPIDFNNRTIYAVVVESLSLQDAKVEIRKADFKTKKIEKRDEKKQKFLKKEEFKMLESFSKKTGTPVGELITYVYGEELIEYKKTKNVTEATYYPDDLTFKVKQEPFSVKGSDIFKRILSEKVETINVIDFNFDRYLNFQSPHISKLELLFNYLEVLGEKVTVNLHTDFLGIAETKFVQEFKSKVITIQVTEKNKKAKKFLVKVKRDKNGEEEVMADEAYEKIKEQGKKFMFVLSHGYADRIFCNDCRKSYDCEVCNHPFSLLAEDGVNFLYCKHCKNKKELKHDQYVICKHCGSWRIFPFGIGGQKVGEFIKEDHILVDESEKKLSPKKIVEKVKEFLNGNTDILIGSIRTLKVLQTIGKEIDKSFIISTGPLVRGKLFDSDERLMRLISQVENISHEVYINKREGDEISLDNYKDKNKFIHDELKIRKSAGLPPFTKVVSLIFHYRVKRNLDKFLLSSIEDFKVMGEIKKGSKFIYYWFKEENNLDQFVEVLRPFGDVAVANSIIEQSVLGKK